MKQGLGIGCAVLVALVLSAGVAQATPINLLTNGSFEAGLTGWAISGGGTYPIAVVQTNAACCFGETVPNDTFNLGTTDLTGNHATYFVDDFAHQILRQSVFLAAGSYEIGFDAYAPRNGFNNSGDAAFSGTIAGVLLANYTVHTQNTPAVWIHFSAIANVLVAGTYEVAFDFQPNGSPSADVLIDRVYVADSDEDGGTPIGTVPEPATLSLLGLGLVGLGVTLRARRK